MLRAALVLSCVLVMALIVLFDETARIIPRQLCWVLSALGVAYQFENAGMEGVVAGIVAAATVLAVIFAACLVGGSNVRAIGGGDVRCMVALALVTGDSCLFGALACCTVAVVAATVQRARGRLLRGEPFPFAPFLAVWLTVGLALAT